MSIKHFVHIFFFLTQKDNYDLNVNPKTFQHLIFQTTQTFIINHQLLLIPCIGKGMQGQKDHLLPDLKELHAQRVDTYPLKCQTHVKATMEVDML